MAEDSDAQQAGIEGTLDGAIVAAEYRAARERMCALAADLDGAATLRTVPACPDWTVRDLFSHVTGLAADLGAGNRPTGGATQAWVDRQVAERRSRSLASVVDEWTEVAPRFEEMLAARPDRLWGLTYDVLVHEHDLRNAVDRPGARDSDGVEVALDLGLRLVAGDLAAHDLPAIAWVDARSGRRRVVGSGEPQLTLRVTPFEALRVLGSRRTLDELRRLAADGDLTGDLDRYLPGLVHMALPVSSLGE